MYIYLFCYYSSKNDINNIHIVIIIVSVSTNYAAGLCFGVTQAMCECIAASSFLSCHIWTADKKNDSVFHFFGLKEWLDMLT